jgi:hypothetical protein
VHLDDGAVPLVEKAQEIAALPLSTTFQPNVGLKREPLTFR